MSEDKTMESATIEPKKAKKVKRSKRAKEKKKAEAIANQNIGTAIKKYVGISRRKCDRIGKICVGKKVEEVRGRLSFFPQRAAKEVLEAIKSAEGNFLNKHREENTGLLVVKNILVDQGPSMRRIIYRARGRADRIKKRSCHIRVVLEKR